MAKTVAIVGAGAAGLMAAWSAATHGARVLLLDRRRKIGAKILISGGTRCNVTNVEVHETDFNAPSMPFVRNVLRQFPPEEARAFFEHHGVGLKLEPTGKYFPTSDSARDVLAGLLRAVEGAGVEIEREALVTGAEWVGDRFRLNAERREGNDPSAIEASAIVLCTGGLSFPETGSDGVGYGIARGFGHRIVRTSPALTPLLAAGGEHAELSGVTLPVRLTLRVDGREAVSVAGSFLFTHKGYSGPAALDVSRHWERRGWESTHGVELRASFVPDLTAEAVEAEWLDEARRAPRRKVVNLLAARLPARLAELSVERSGIDRETTLGALTRDARRCLLAAVTDARLPVTGLHGYGKAEVTAGGVALDEVVARSMESRLRPGLFFAGEILDVDGRIGGFNFQWAWSSGWVAGRAASLAFRAPR
jgi:predicted Rossmann fold flavoprotein